jgi:selenium metabolism protein YedF
MNKILVINRDELGEGNTELGKKLMGIFLRKLWGNPNKPQTIVLYNSAVKLAVDGSSVLDALDGLAQAGVDIISCVTCIEFFELKDKVKAGRISNMQEIVESLMQAEQVITI